MKWVRSISAVLLFKYTVRGHIQNGNQKSPILQLQFINANICFMYDILDTVFTKINIGYSKNKHCSSSLGLTLDLQGLSA